MMLLRGFQSTLSSRRATEGTIVIEDFSEISIHALLTESDQCFIQDLCIEIISIHALLTESDFEASGVSFVSLQISIHALLTESDDICA